MNQNLIKLVLAVACFIAGAKMIIDGLGIAAAQAMSEQTLTALWWLVPGIILLIISYPLGYYYINKVRHGYKGSRQDDVLKAAQRELGEINAKK